MLGSCDMDLNTVFNAINMQFGVLPIDTTMEIQSVGHPHSFPDGSNAITANVVNLGSNEPPPIK
jgi:hypothetical protein